jgi:hypothetical protein
MSRSLSLNVLKINESCIWSPGDPVHGCAEFYKVAATVIAASLIEDRDGGGDWPPAKRPRLESVIAQREGATVGQPNRKPTASWSTGTLPPARG